MKISKKNEEMRDHLPKLLSVLSGIWTMNILHVLHSQGPTRFGELKRRLGTISTKTLTERLRTLEGDGLVARHYEPTVPPQVTYSLTKKTGELATAICELQKIADRWYGGTKR